MDLVILYIKYMSAAFKTKIDCISFVVQGTDSFGNDSANFLPVPTCHGVGISGAALECL